MQKKIVFRKLSEIAYHVTDVEKKEMKNDENSQGLAAASISPVLIRKFSLKPQSSNWFFGRFVANPSW